MRNLVIWNVIVSMALVAVDIAHDLDFRGVARLDDEWLAVATSMRAAILGDADAPACGRIVKGTLNNREVSAMVLRPFSVPQLPDTARCDLTRAMFTS